MTLDIRDGSVKTLWRVSLPLILSFLSLLGMITVDRLFLAGYSAAALGAAASAGTTAWGLTFGGQTLTNIAGVFVAQHNGAGRTKEIGQPVWQMIWLSCLFCIPYAIAAIWVAPWIFAGSPIEQEQLVYYRWTMVISPLTCLTGALNGFFSGRGQTKIITWMTLLANVVNFVLDPILIFGWGSIPSLGIHGACIATLIGSAMQVAALFYLFLKPEAREKYGTGNYVLKFKVWWDCVRIGGPEALGVVLELSAWGAFYMLFANLSTIHILVASVGQSMLMAFFWFGIGVENGISSVAGNLIGAGKKEEVRRAFYSGMKIVGVFSLALFCFLALGKDWIVDLFLKNPEGLEGAETLAALSVEQINDARLILVQSCFMIGAYVAIENVRCLLYGVLRAAGDTFFILMLSVMSTWSLLLLPTYQLMTVWKMPVSYCFWIWLWYAILTTGISYLRFAKGNWMNRTLFSHGV
jgi:MATE family multidrug resistance protein